MRIDDWHQAGRYFVYKETHHIFYNELIDDQKEVLLLLHGFPTASWEWHKVWHALSEKFHLITLDFIGYGFSDKPRYYNYNTLDQADLVEALLAERSIKKAHILCHDFGNTVMQELLSRQIEGSTQMNYISVCFLNGGVIPEYHKPRFIQKLLLSPIGILMAPFLSKRKLKKSFEAIFGKTTQPSQQEIDAFYSLINYNGGKYIFHKLIRYMQDRVVHRERWVNVLANCPVPICMVNGNQDPISGGHLSAVIKQQYKNIQVVDLKSIGHYPQTEAPEMLLDAFFEFHREAFT